MRTAAAKAAPVAEARHSHFFSGAESGNVLWWKSRRDLIIQPSVDAMQSRLRWVTNQNVTNPERVESLRVKR